MLVALDGLVFQGKQTGVGKYYLGIIENLIQSIPELEFVIITNKVLTNIPPFLIGTKVIVDVNFTSKLKYIVWVKFFLGRLLKKSKADVYFSCNTFLPRRIDGIKTLGILHDFNHIIVPETMPFTNYLAHKLFMRSDCKKIDFLISNSNATSSKALRYFGISINEVIEPKINPIYHKRDQKEVENFLIRMGITYPYILSVATFEPRKNIDKTIDVFLKLKSDKKDFKYKLILVGGTGWKNSRIEELLANGSQDIVQLGYVSDEYLAYLYNGAAVFVFPSKYEGYGIPVREAMQSGCKVLTSNIEELVEVSGGYAAYFDLSEQNSYMEALLTLLKSENVHPYNFQESKMEGLLKYLKNCKEQLP